MIYFDNAASSHPKPSTVVRAVADCMRRNGANPGRSGHRLSMDAAEIVYNTRVALGRLFGVSKPENVILVPNATYGINTVLFGLFKKGDHIVTTDLEHNSVLRPLNQLRKNGVDVTIVKVNFESVEQTINGILDAVTPRTKGIVCTQCSNISGYMLPIEQIAFYKPESVFLIVDGSQGAGTISLDIVKSRVDYYCAPSHKGLLGPQGGGVILINNRIPDPLVFGGTGTESLNPDQPSDLPERLESGTIPASICAGMLAGAEYIEARGLDYFYSQKKELTDYAYASLRGVPKIELYMLPYLQYCLGVVPFNIEGRHSGEVVSFLNDRGIYTRGGLHCAPLFHQKMKTESRGMVRISFGCFNTKSEIDTLTYALKKIS